MTLQEYSKEIEQFVAYDRDHKYPWIYPYLGFQEEIEEFDVLLGFTPEEMGKTPEEYHKLVMKELGDCFWMWVRMHVEFKIDLPDLENCISQEFFTSPIMPYEMSRTLARLVRGDNHDHYMDHLQLYLIGIGYSLIERIPKDITLEEILRLNIEKLKKRKEDGTIKGEGDER